MWMATSRQPKSIYDYNDSSMVVGSPATTGARHRRRRAAEETRAVMLEAGLRLALRTLAQGAEDPAAAGALSHIRVTEVADEATRLLGERGEASAKPVTSGSIYQLWPTQSEFQVDLMFHLLERGASPAHEALQRRTLELVAAGGPVEKVVDELADLAAETLQADEIARHNVRFFALSSHPDVARGLRESYELNEQRMRPVHDAVLLFAGWRLRDGYTMKDLMVATTAVLEGLALRASVDSEATDGAHHGRSLAARML